MKFKLTEDNWIDFAIAFYNTKYNLLLEIYTDLKHIKYLKKYIRTYMNNKNPQDIKCILNRIIILTNLFGKIGTFNLAFFSLPPDYYPILKTFMQFLNYIPKERVIFIDNLNIDDIYIDEELLKKLKEM